MTRRLWTAQDQITAEVAAACGVSYHDIGRALNRDHSVVRVHMNQSAYKQQKEKNRKWRESNPDHYSYWLETNYDKKRESECRWVKMNPIKAKEKSRRNGSLRRASHRRALQPVTSPEIDARFTLWRNRCAFCGVDANHPRNAGRERLTIEHVLALTKNGLDEADNIMPSCSICNCSKSNTPIEKWYRRQPFFTKARWRKICRHCPAAVVGQLPLAFSPAVAEPA
jgi:hypothetical protein